MTTQLKTRFLTGFEPFFTELERRRRSPRTIQCYASDLLGLARWFEGEMGRPLKPADIDVGCALAYRAALEHSGRSAATIQRRMTTVRRCADWAARHGLLPIAAAEQLMTAKSAPRRPRTTERAKGLSSAALARLLAQIEADKQPRDLAITRVLLDTGLKVGELVRLGLDAVDLREGWLSLPDGPAGPRRVPLTAPTMGALASYLETRGLEPGALFRGERGALGANAIQRVLRSYGRRLGIDVSPGVLRHTFAQRLLATGARRLELADALGHGCLESARVYRARNEAPPVAGVGVFA